jgi:hypothetical protein
MGVLINVGRRRDPGSIRVMGVVLQSEWDKGTVGLERVWGGSDEYSGVPFFAEVGAGCS